MELRQRQIECLDAIRSEYLAGVHQQLVVQATGTGKMVIISGIYRKMHNLLPGKMLAMVHTKELVKQLIDNMREWNPGLKVGREQAESYADTDCDVVVSCVPTIGKEGSTRLARFGGFNIVACDEAHHSIAQTYMNIFSAEGVLLPDTNKLLVGFTATPKRKNLTKTQQKQVKTLDEGDILSLSSVYKKIVYKYTLKQAIKEGWLVRLRGYRVHTDTKLDNVKITAGEYQKDELSRTVNTQSRTLQAIKTWKEHAEGRQTVGFCVDIAHAEECARLAREHGIKAEAVWGDDPERDEKLRRHQNKEITWLFNAQLLIEGYDDWRVSCIVLLAPTPNSSKFTQQVGRGTRLQAGTGNLLDAIKAGTPLEKRDCLVIDVVDNSSKCSLVTFPTLVGLAPEFDLQGDDIIAASEKMEELQERYPGVDLTHLTDLTQVKTYIESIDLFAEPYTEEVKEFSKFTWMAVQDGSYVLAIPERKDIADEAKKDYKAYARYLHEKLHIALNELDEYDLSITSVEQNRQLGTFHTLKEAFEEADDVIRRCRGDRVKLMVRDAFWHHNAPSDAAKRYLRKLTKGKAFWWCLCNGSPFTEATILQLKGVCPTCKRKLGLTAGQASQALSVLQTLK